MYANGFGYADIKSKKPMTSYIKLRAASVSKLITTMGIMKLVHEKKLDLDVPITEYIPYLNPKYESITCRHLLGHTSGLVNKPKGEWYKKKQFNSIRPTVSLSKEDLLFKPGSSYNYSTHAFNMLAAAIEGASGERYIDYMQNEIFDALGMDETCPENLKEIDSLYASLYYFRKGKLKLEKKAINGSYKLAGAGFRTTPSDLVKMTKAFTSEFLSKDVVNEIFKSQVLTNGDKTHVGLGWRISIDAFGHTVVEHAGSWMGARTVIVYYPEEELSVSMMINAQSSIFIEETAHIIAELYRSGQSQNRQVSLESKVKITNRFNKKQKQSYTGTIKMINGSGFLECDDQGFLNSNPMIALNSVGDFALITRYGILYTKISLEHALHGDIFIYGSRNEVNPISNAPLITFKEAG